MTREHVRMAMSSINSSKTRSFLTMLGIIVGVSSVITVAGLGKGLKNQAKSQLQKLGSNLIIVQAGKHNKNGGLDFFRSGISSGTISEQDASAVSKLANIDSVTPVSTITGLPSYAGKSMSSSFVVGSTENLANILGRKVEFGAFFAKNDLDKAYAIIGHTVAEKLFAENVPIGKTLQIKGEDFIVQGVFEQTPITPLSPSVNFNEAVVIPYGKAKSIASDSLRISQLLVSVKSAAQTADTTKQIKKTILNVHGGQEDFSVLNQEEAANLTDNTFYQLNNFISGAAIVALIVGAIGIMNVMYAHVSERTREIGVRKAVGATNNQIVGQFVAEAMTISLVGGAIGVVVSLLTIGLLRATTNLQPAFSVSATILALVVTILSGIVSGILPAIKAARKDPIDALRGF